MNFMIRVFLGICVAIAIAGFVDYQHKRMNDEYENIDSELKQIVKELDEIDYNK